MQYFDKTFWRMAAGFALIIILGLASVYLLSLYRGTNQAPTASFGID